MIQDARYIALIVAYDGTDFCGSQRQNNGRSVQGELEQALEHVLKHPAPLLLAGRTDAGVHATGQCGRFETTNRIPTQRVPLALNGVLDRAVRVSEARDVERDFHPRYSARSRVYRYTMQTAAFPNPLLQRTAAHMSRELDVAGMREAAGALIGRHDFSAWRSAGSPTPSTVRTVKDIQMRRGEAFGTPLLEIEIEADAFLYQMVRNIVGALIEVGQSKKTAGDILRLTQGRDRTKCPPPAPPQGLCLVQVKYPNVNN